MVIAALLSACALLLAILAEAVHARRVHRAARLAFGARSSLQRWTAVAPAARVLGVTLLIFGGTLLLLYRPALVQTERTPDFSRRLLICLDVSPSMLVKDAGPEIAPVERAAWAYAAVKPLLDSIDTRDTRITLIAFYTRSIPILTDTNDMDVVANLLNGIRLYRAFTPGDTDLEHGVNAALKHAAPWAADSATLLVISDGDANAGLTGIRPKPPSIAQTIVIGLGDTTRAGTIGDRRSRQNAASLKALAARLNGAYVDCNRTTLPPHFSSRLLMRAPSPPVDRVGRDIGLACVGVGGTLAALTGPALVRFGIGRRATVRVPSQGVFA